MGSSDELRIGVIGAGGRGGLARHAHMPDKGVRAGGRGGHRAQGPGGVQADLRAGRIRRGGLPRPAQGRDVDAVFVTTPDYCHEEHAMAACQAGKHVYLEKPMAITIAGCDRILAAARKAGVRLYLGHNMRHFAVVRKMKELIDAGRHRRAQGRLVPAFRLLRRRRVLQGLARRADKSHQPAAPEGRPRHRRAALAVPRLLQARHGHGRADALRPHHRPPQPRRARRRVVVGWRTGRRWRRRGSTRSSTWRTCP